MHGCCAGMAASTVPWRHPRSSVPTPITATHETLPFPATGCPVVRSPFRLVPSVRIPVRCSRHARADCSVLDRLTNVLPKLTSEDLYAVTVNGGTFYAVGSHGAALRSSDGRIWQNSRPATPNSLVAVAAGGPGVVVVWDAGTAVFSDGAAWTAGSVTPKTNLTSVAFGNDVFVAVGAGGNAFTSAYWQGLGGPGDGYDERPRAGGLRLGRFRGGRQGQRSLCVDRRNRLDPLSARGPARPSPPGQWRVGMSADNRVASSMTGASGRWWRSIR